MGRRRKNDDLEEMIVKLGGLLIILLFLAVGPKYFAAVLQNIVAFVICAAVLIGLVILGIFLIKKKIQSRRENVTLVSPRSSNVYNPEIDLPPPPLTTRDLIEKLRKIDWFQFEKLVELIYWKHGYEVTRKGGAKPDGGIDLIVEKDGQRNAVQCKQWKTWNVGVKAIREFLGALTDAGIQKGNFVTLNGYTGEAKTLAEKHGIEIINENGLVAMIEETDLISNPETIAILQDTEKYCPKCESKMILRTAMKGSNAGQKFWGCSAYPRCHFTMPFEIP